MRRIENRLVPDPSMTDSEFLYQKAANPTKPNIGKVWVATNMPTLIGGLAYIRRALDHHKRAAEWFKNAYEGLYGGVAPAIDAGKVRVDTSIMAHDNGMVARLDQARDLRELFGTNTEPGLMRKEALDRIVATVVLGIPCDDFADEMPSGQKNQRQVAEAVDLLLKALDELAEIRGYKSRAA
jgi:hypothetical protein